MSQDIYQLKVMLRHSQPLIWRRIQVEGDTTLGELHDVLQIVMGWENDHLHAFRVGRTSYGIPDPEFSTDVQDEDMVFLDEVAAKGDTFIYEYDFGDGWEHEIKVEKILSAEPEVNYPVCLSGERACPPEDCGGVYGYQRLLEILGNPEHEEYADMAEWIGDEFDPETLDIDAINAELNIIEAGAIPPASVYSDEELAGFDSEELLDLMIGDEDRVPRNVIDECARRGDEMVERLRPLLKDDDVWDGDADLGEWWLLLHAVMILGLIPSEHAGFLLIDFMRRMSDAEEDSLQEWLAGYWPALFRNKPETVFSPLRELCQDRSVSWFIRANAIDAVVADAKRNGELVLEQTLAWLADIAAKEQEDWELRLSAGYVLLCFPRARYRALLDDLVSRQPERMVYFSADEVQKAYAEMKDQPEWECFQNPWQFYEPEAIEKRQQRWEEEIIANEAGEWEEDDWDFDADVFTPDVREIPKTGRNDPCPCGSGKKYKKCCLQ